MAPPSSSISPSPRLLHLALFLWVSVTLVVSGPTCPAGDSSMVWLSDPDDCSKFYVCHLGQRHDFDCGENVWIQDVKTCVGKGSHLDTCTIAKELDELNSCAHSNSAVFAKADNCAQYYDCSSEQATVSADTHVVECTFPKLFNISTKTCENYSTVECGDRPEPKDACDYVANQCQRAHCVPCNVRFPSCDGQPNGFNPWVGREYSPYFVLCQDGRALYQGTCDNSKGAHIFDPEKRVCVEMKKESGSQETA